MIKQLSEIVKVIKENENFLIFTHQNVDGDAVGSASALCSAIRALGKKAFIILSEAVPHYLEPLCERDLFVTEFPFGSKEYVAVAVDCSETSRIGDLKDLFCCASVKLCVDHHEYDPSVPFADYSFIDNNAAAAAVLIFELLQSLEIGITKKIAEYLYLAISTDTGSFKFQNADARALLLCSKLYDYGIDHVSICNCVYGTKPFAQLKIEAAAIQNSELFADGKAVVSYVSIRDMEDAGCSYAMTETCIDRLREIEGVDAACFLKQIGAEDYKVSFRSKEKACVLLAAKALGGGGHKMAAGCTLTGCSLKEAIESVKVEILKIL